MKRILSGLAALALALIAPNAKADTPDPLGDLIARVIPEGASNAAMQLEARLYHSGGGIRALDSLGCRVSAMRTLAVDPRVIPRRTVLFIKETVGMILPNGKVHDGFWYASDIGGGVKGKRVDLFTGGNASSMRQFFARKINAAALTATPMGTFQGCPPLA